MVQGERIIQLGWAGCVGGAARPLALARRAGLPPARVCPRRAAAVPPHGLNEAHIGVAL